MMQQGLRYGWNGDCRTRRLFAVNAKISGEPVSKCSAKLP